MLFFGLAFMGGWAAAAGALVYAVVTLVRIRSEDWTRRHGHPLARLLVPTPTFLRFDVTLAVTALLADLWLVSTAIVFGADGVFTEDWMGYPGMMDLTGRGYQAAVVSALRTTAWWTCGIAVLGRCWITAGVQVCLLPPAAWWIGTFDTYYT
ncbi:hypothetical protein ACIP4U_17130 [Streptomyces caelestis]|jgi:hypothetical protein|uniref:Uncharacterized protein n=1 Tax=Streptomyces caelestis TaxID=36816 RepID=A0A7W9LR08_9ACTN|nr:hypothetical protein [Streptomyces caelestis]MBB5792955.1 hypothetical protein [Streptomyces caelestis]GGW75378.1 hypothetical protein GCM10010320_66510 [Streptomyces caelestis]